MEPCYCGNPSCTIGQKKKEPHNEKAADFPKDEIKQDPKELEEPEALLCPGKVKGFALTDKVCAEFRIDRLTDTVWNEVVYGRLEMAEKYKHVIGVLEESHRKHSNIDSAEFDDVIAGKGLRSVFLLQGPLGLGRP